MCIESVWHRCMAGAGQIKARWPVLAVVWACAAGMAQGQILSSPVPMSKPVPGAASGAAAAPAGVPGVAPLGSGAGQHSPDSPFPALPKRNDVVPWSVLIGGAVVLSLRREKHGKG